MWHRRRVCSCPTRTGYKGPAFNLPGWRTGWSDCRILCSLRGERIERVCLCVCRCAATPFPYACSHFTRLNDSALLRLNASAHLALWRTHERDARVPCQRVGFTERRRTTTNYCLYGLVWHTKSISHWHWCALVYLELHIAHNQFRSRVRSTESFVTGGAQNCFPACQCPIRNMWVNLYI